MDADQFVRMVRTMFTQRRKTIANALKPFARRTRRDPVEEPSQAAGIDPDAGRRRSTWRKWPRLPKPSRARKVKLCYSSGETRPLLQALPAA